MNIHSADRYGRICDDDRKAEIHRPTMLALAKVPLIVAALTTLVVTALAWLAPSDYAGSLIGLTFCGVAYWMVLRKDTQVIRQHGSSLAGLLEPERLEPIRIAEKTGLALAWCLGLSALFFPAFWYGYVLWWQPLGPLRPNFGEAPFEELASQVLMTALPEELFYRGYLQSALDRVWPPPVNILGAKVGAGLLVSSIIFALGHIATEPHPSRLAVFFPSLVFGWLRARTGGLGACVLFHATCNVMALFLARSYGFVN